MITKLDELFKKRYTKFFEDMNKNVYPSIKDENSNYMVPVVSLGKGGLEKKGSEVKASTAIVSTKLTPVLESVYNYKIAVPVSEVEIALKNEYYFNHYFDSILNSALANLAKEIGDSNSLKWGDHYVRFTRPDGTVFKEMSVGTASDDFYELNLTSDLASNTIVQKI